MSNALVPIVRTEAGAVFANSRDVADFFGKEHKDVLRDVRKLATALSAQNCAQWFTPSTYQAKVGYGLRTLPAFNMTKDGFALLVMGFTGQEALRFKVAYIHAFNEMEATLRVRGSRPRFEVVAQEFLGRRLRALVTEGSFEVVGPDLIEMAYPSAATAKQGVGGYLASLLPADRRLVSRDEHPELFVEHPYQVMTLVTAAGVRRLFRQPHGATRKAIGVWLTEGALPAFQAASKGLQALPAR